ncbi:MAG: FxsA family protein [Chloroflexi bacterium]|nr:FxsA family protein [Chloroflexota bacterium]
MLLKLLLLFVLLPVVELALLLEIGRRIGTLPTIAIIVVTGVAGAYLARREGLGVLRRIRADVHEGRMPGPAIVDGVIVLLAGAVLLTPGVLTDILGFLCLIPATRRVIRAALWRALTRAVRQGRTGVHVTFDDVNARQWHGTDSTPDR